MSELRDKLRTYIVENYLFGQDGHFQDTDSFWDLGIMDSTGVLELISHLEVEYAIVLGPDEIVPANLDSVEKLTRFVSRKLAHARSDSPESVQGNGKVQR